MECSILNATVSMVSETWQKLREHSIKSGGDLEKVSNMMLAIAAYL